MRRGRMRKGYEKEEGLALPTSVALANRQMSLSLTQVNHVSWGGRGGGVKKERRSGREGTSKAKIGSAVLGLDVSACLNEIISNYLSLHCRNAV